MGDDSQSDQENIEKEIKNKASELQRTAELFTTSKVGTQDLIEYLKPSPFLKNKAKQQLQSKLQLAKTSMPKDSPNHIDFINELLRKEPRHLKKLGVVKGDSNYICKTNQK